MRQQYQPSEPVVRRLDRHAGAEIVYRDRHKLYAEAARRGALRACQVADYMNPNPWTTPLTDQEVLVNMQRLVILRPGSCPVITLRPT